MYRVTDFYDDYNGQYRNGEAYTMRFFNDGAYACYLLTKFTTSDATSHKADGREVYASIS